MYISCNERRNKIFDNSFDFLRQILKFLKEYKRVYNPYMIRYQANSASSLKGHRRISIESELISATQPCVIFKVLMYAYILLFTRYN